MAWIRFWQLSREKASNMALKNRSRILDFYQCDPDILKIVDARITPLWQYFNAHYQFHDNFSNILRAIYLQGFFDAKGK